MSYYYNKNNKVCATCRNWLGNRQPDNPPGQVKVDHNAAMGKCIGRLCNQQSRSANSCCSEWEQQFR